MRKCTLSVFIACVITQSSASTSVEKADDILVNPEASSEVPIAPRLPHYGEITADDQPDHHPENHRQIRFQNDAPSTPVKFENDNKEDNYLNTDNINVNTDPGNISFKEDEHDRILTPSDQENNEDFGKTVSFGAPENIDSADIYRHHSDVENDKQVSSQCDDEKSDDNNLNLENNGDESDSTEDNDDELSSDTTKEDIEDEKSIVPKRITFEDGGNKELQQPVPTKKRKSRRKPRVRAPPTDNALNTPSHSYTGLRFPGYPGYPGPRDQNSGYSGYQPVYPPPGYPGYPIYSTPYPTPPYSTPGYPGYSPYAGYPGAYPGYNPYPVYPGAPGSHPHPNPTGYPNQTPQVTPPEINFPNNEYPGATPERQPLPERPGPYPGQEHAGAGYSGYPAQPGHPGYSGYGHADPSGQYGQYRPYPGHQPYYGPTRRPKSLPQRAISAVAEALTSIALFDDKQCVPRLLCEVASGGAASSPTLQKASDGLRPLLTVLQSYNSASSSPLFLFGRAAVLGVTTKGNPTSCRYAYPQCPNDPESLINYLNNHNGGFFRFFGQPENPNQQQNLEQFYSQLAGQYGQQQQPPKQQQNQQLQNQQQSQHQQLNYGNPYDYGLQYPYSNIPNYGQNYYREQNTFRNTEEIDSEPALSNIEERIQNKPGTDAIEDYDGDEKGSKWTFPDEVGNNIREEKPKQIRKQKSKRPTYIERPTRVERGGSTLKFPEDRGSFEDKPVFNREREYIRDQKGIFFPNDNHFNFQSYYHTTTPVNLDEYVFDYKHNFYVKRPKAIVNDDSQTLYIVRGNGDPNHPEIVKVTPGQTG